MHACTHTTSRHYPSHAYHRYIHACICLKHYDLLFKYMNPLSYQIMIFVSLLHPHNPLTLVATTSFLSCIHARTLPIGIIHRTHAIFFFRSVSHEGTHTHIPLSIISGILYLSCACATIDDLCVCVYS